MEHLNKDRTPVGTYSKLQDKRFGPFRIAYKINDNVHVFDLVAHRPLDYAPTFSSTLDSNAFKEGGLM